MVETHTIPSIETSRQSHENVEFITFVSSDSDSDIDFIVLIDRYREFPQPK